MDWYIVVKEIKGRRYRYRQKTWRERGRVRTRSEYVCPDRIVGYHGTFAKFEKFDTDHLGSANECDSSFEGFYFASNRKVAVSYASTWVARNRSLRAKLRTIEARISWLTDGLSIWSAFENLDSFEPMLRNKINNFLCMYNRVHEKLHDQEITRIVESKRGEVKKCVLDLRNPYIHDMRGCRYDDYEFTEACRLARDSGHDGVIIKRTYDPATDVARIEGSSMTDVYIVFDPDCIAGAG